MVKHEGDATELMTKQEPRTLFDILIHCRKTFTDDIAYIYRAGDQEIEVKYGKVFVDVLLLAKAFSDRGVSRHDRVMFLSDNRYSWIVTDLALMSLGAVTVPRGSDTPSQELLYIMQNSGCTHLVIETPELFELHKESLKKVGGLKTIFVMAGPAMHSLFGKTFSYQDLLKNRTYSEADMDRFIERGQSLGAGDLLTVIYTSGTTGMPKGVKLSHANVMHNINCIPGIIELSNTDRWLSILPSWHIFERTAEYVAFAQGCCLVYSSIKTFSLDLEQYRPNVVATVPRVWESLYNKVQSAVKKKGRTAALLFDLLVSVSKTYRHNRRILKGQLPVFTDQTSILELLQKSKALLVCLILYFPYRLARKKLGLVQQRFGGRLRLAVSGGGSLVDFLEDWLDAVGIRIVNAYGMTECSPAIAGRGLDCTTYGTIGFPVTDTELRIVSESGAALPAGTEGLIEVKGPQVTSGYDNNEAETKKAFTGDGFLKTGDLGMLTIHNELLITGRAKDIIVLASGENIDPSRIESTLTTFPFIEDAVLVGQDRKGLGALLVPDLEELRTWVGTTFDSIKKEKEHLLTDSTILERVRKELNLHLKPNRGFKPYERLHGITFLEKSLQKGEELTNTLKKKRHIIEKNYRETINQLFN